MLFFLDMPTNIICGDSSSNSNADSHSWLWIGVWLCLYKIYAATLMALCSGESTSDETTYSRRCLLSNVKEHLLVSICPRRRARFLKCQQRRRKTCRRRDDEEGDSNESHQESASSSSSCCRQADQCCDKLCEFGKAFFKLHLPPPLPFFKRRKSKQQQNASCPDDCICCRCKNIDAAADIDTSSSSGDSSTSESITKPLQHTVFQPLQKPSRSSSTLLIDMARMQQWNVLLNHVNRRGAKHRDQDGLHPLHWACSGSPPLVVVQALLEAYPSAARKLDAEGSTPLHFATHYAAPLAVMESLVQAYPKAVKMQDKYGRTPLYHAVEKSLSLDVIKLLVNVDAGCILLPCLPKSKRTAAPVETRDVAVRTPLYLAWASALKDRSTRLKCKGKQWDKAEWLLQAATTQANGDATTLLEQIVTMDLFMPEQVVNLVLLARPELGNDSNALMAAASMQHYSCERAIHLIRALLRHNTAAAFALTSHGRSILACAANVNQPWEVIQALFEASPEMIQWRDARTGLAPAMLAAASEQVTVARQSLDGVFDSDPYNLLPAKQKELLNASTKTTSSSTASLEAPVNHDALHLNTIYGLLQMDPSVLWNASNRPSSRPILMA